MDGSRLVRARNSPTERGYSYWLQLELNALREQFALNYEDTMELRKQNAELRAENETLKRRIAELTQSPSSKESDAAPAGLPAFRPSSNPIPLISAAASPAVRRVMKARFVLGRARLIVTCTHPCRWMIVASSPARTAARS